MAMASPRLGSSVRHVSSRKDKSRTRKKGDYVQQEVLRCLATTINPPKHEEHRTGEVELY